MAAATQAYAAAAKTNGLLTVAEARIARADALSSAKRYDKAIGDYVAVLRDDAASAVPDLVWRATFGRGRAYEAVGHIRWPGLHHRTDIASAAVAG